MKIGVITLPLNHNYGGILQAFALQTVLKRMGHDVTLLDHYVPFPVLPWWKAPIAYIRRPIAKYIFKTRKLRVFHERYEKYVYNKMIVHLQEFINTNIDRIVLKHFRSLRKHWDYDAVVVGSDQVWRCEYFPEQIENAFLDFVKDKDIKRVAYAASFGKDEPDYTEEEIAHCAELVKKFNGVSVREASGVSICKNKFGVEALHVLDPTLLLSKEDYMRLVERKKPAKSKGNLMVSILDMTDEKRKMVKTAAKQTGLTPFYTISEGLFAYDVPIKDRIIPPLESWLQGFHDAEFVITDSFHACVFSIIFHKPFLAIGNEGRGMSRFTSLLSTFGLESRLVKDVKDFDFSAPIDWKDVDSRRAKLKERSLSFLQEALGK